ncbi:hypothetical protein L1077_22075 [Pseudoalteromonas luteoviolacea]|uniref:hypothetical protein n=1 Tax=Pseudoalteromonas luteoviolacea TaxID=43657 RepID=UPI001F19D703|nr:hypothetical protein [Pseudoalteromonas luteoviolacea]MCF6442118.1 hypothetical protein [Pseudoalteromonas luteoviolacea]
MNLTTRKLWYLFFGAGGYLAGIPAILGLTASGISVLLGEVASLDLFVVTLGGFIGLSTATFTWLNLPISKLKIKAWLTLGITVGCGSSIAALTIVWTWPPVFLNGDFWDISIGSYVYFLPPIVGLILICEIWLAEK